MNFHSLSLESHKHEKPAKNYSIYDTIKKLNSHQDLHQEKKSHQSQSKGEKRFLPSYLLKKL